MPELILTLLALLFAEVLPTSVTGTIVDASSVPYYPANVTACLSPSTTNPRVNGQPVNTNPGSNYCLGTTTNSSGTFQLQLYPNSGITPANTQWQFTVSTSGIPPPTGTGPQTFQSVITVSGTSQDVGAILSAAAPSLSHGGGSGTVTAVTASSPLASSGGTTPNITATGLADIATSGSLTDLEFGNNVVWAKVLPGGQAHMGVGTHTSGSPNISDPLATWDSSMVGWVVRVHSTLLGNAFPVNTTIVSVTDATHAVLSANATYSNGGGADIGVYPRDETATINDAIGQAYLAGNCGSVVIPRGLYLVTSSFSNLNDGQPDGCGNWANGAGPSLSIAGFPDTVQGKGTAIIIPPDFSWASCTASSVCFPNMRVFNMSFNGMGYTALPAAAQNKTLVTAYGVNFDIHHLGATTVSGFTAWRPIINGGGCIECFFDGTGVVDISGFFVTFSGYIESGSYMRIGNGGSLQIASNGTEIAGIEMYGSGAVYCSAGARLTTGTMGGVSAIVKSTTTGVNVWLDGCAVVPSTGNVFYATPGNSMNVHATHMNLGGSVTNFANGPVTFYDDCGNNFQGSLASWTGAWYGSCSITGSPLVAGNIALTSGWDTTGTPGTISGASQRGQFTLTLAGSPGSTGVITITFPRAFQVAPICKLSEVGGTNAIATNIQTTSTSTTTVVFTITHTPVAGNTEIFQYDCMNP